MSCPSLSVILGDVVVFEALSSSFYQIRSFPFPVCGFLLVLFLFLCLLLLTPLILPSLRMFHPVSVSDFVVICAGSFLFPRTVIVCSGRLCSVGFRSNRLYCWFFAKVNGAILLFYVSPFYV